MWVGGPQTSLFSGSPLLLVAHKEAFVVYFCVDDFLNLVALLLLE